MRQAAGLFFVAAAYAAVIPRQNAPDVGGIVGGALEAAGSGVTAAGEGLKGGGIVTSLPSGILESVGDGLSATGAALSGKGPKMTRRQPRQAVGDVGGIIGSALEHAGSSLKETGKGMEESAMTSIPGEVLQSLGDSLIGAGQAAKGSTGNPRRVVEVARRQAPRPGQPSNNDGGNSVAQGAAPALGTVTGSIAEGAAAVAKGAKDAAKGAKDALSVHRRQIPPPSGIVGSVGSNLAEGAAAAGGAGSGIVGQVGKGLEEGAKGAKDSAKGPKMIRRQELPSVGDVLSGTVGLAGSITSTVGQGLNAGAAAKQNGDVGAAGSIVSSIGEALSSAAKGSKVKRQTGPTAADAIGGAVQGAGGITGAVADGLKGSPLTAPAGSIVEGVAGGLNAAGGKTGSKGKLNRRQTSPAPGTLTGTLTGAAQSAGGITGAIADGLKGSPITAPVGAIVDGVSEGLNAAGGKGKGMLYRRQTPATPGSPADNLGAATQSAGGITGALADGLKGSPITAPAGAIVEGVSQGLTTGGDAVRGGKGSR